MISTRPVFCARARVCSQKLETSQSSMILAVKGSRLAAYSFPRSLSFTTPLLGQLTQEILEWDRLPELGWLAELSAMLGRHTAKTAKPSR